MKRNKKNIEKLNHKMIDMISHGHNVEIGLIDRNRYFITADGREAIIFRREECLLDIDKLMTLYGEAALYLPIPKARRHDFDLIDVYDPYMEKGEI